jgi:hypothetical protein
MPGQPDAPRQAWSRRIPRALGPHGMFEAKTVALFVITAIAEIVGCYLPLL